MEQTKSGAEYLSDYPAHKFRQVEPAWSGGDQKMINIISKVDLKNGKKNKRGRKEGFM